MIKEILTVAVFTFIATNAQAKHPVVQESMTLSESFKVETSAPSKKEAKRELAGDGYKRPHYKVQRDLSAPENAPTDHSDSEVQYWQYSE